MFEDYQVNGFYDEMIDEGGDIRSGYRQFKNHFETLGIGKVRDLQHSTDRAQHSMGMTFNVYSHGQGMEKILPLDVVPRIITAEEWAYIEKGLKQRITALNLFLQDIYNDQKIVKDKVVPAHVIETCPHFLKPCMGLQPPHGIWAYITGTDIIRDKDGAFYVLEDNLRVPSGVSYMLENRELLKRTFPNLFEQMGVQPVYDYPNHLLEVMRGLSDKPNPTSALLTPGIYNSAYYEHSYLALQMGIELVQGSDLVVRDDHVYMRTTQGFEQVDVIYRRIDDGFLDPTVFKEESMLGVPGIFEAYKKGNVTLMNAPGTGVADDKVVYAYAPRIIKYYLDEEASLPNVPTYICEEEDDQQYVLDNIEKLVVKEANSAGGYGMLIGPKSTKEEQEEFRKRIKADPRNYIAQPTISLSRVPTVVGDAVEGRHVDLRPFILYGKDGIEVMPGGLTRVALKKGSLVVNSSQGGGSKDTWVLYE